MPDRYVKLPHTTNSNSHLLYTVYPVVFYTSCRVLASGPCPNCTVCLMDVWDSLILLMINSYLLPLCSIPSGSLHFILCTCISPLPEPHTMPNKHMRLPPSSSLPSGCLLIFFLFVSLHRAHSPTAQSTQRFFTLLFMLWHQILAQTAYCNKWLLLLYQKFSNYSVLSCFIA